MYISSDKKGILDLELGYLLTYIKENRITVEELEYVIMKIILTYSAKRQDKSRYLKIVGVLDDVKNEYLQRVIKVVNEKLREENDDIFLHL